MSQKMAFSDNTFSITPLELTAVFAYVGKSLCMLPLFHSFIWIDF